jgi:hypothetical protein
MRLARFVFICAGIWGLIVLLPFYALIDVTGRRYVAPTEYPQFFYGFFSVALAFQVAFLVIGSDPARFRPLMLPSIVEKLGYVATLTVLYATGRISNLDVQPVWPDLTLGVLFIAAWVATRPSVPRHTGQTRPARL